MKSNSLDLKSQLKISRNEIDWKSLIFGSAFCAVLAMIGSKPELWFLTPFSAIGLLYVGYEAKNLVWGGILGAIGSLMLFAVTMEGGLGPIVYTTQNIVLILITCLIIGAVTGIIGFYVKKKRIEAYKIREAELKKKNKKK